MQRKNYETNSDRQIKKNQDGGYFSWMKFEYRLVLSGVYREFLNKIQTLFKVHHICNI